MGRCSGAASYLGSFDFALDLFTMVSGMTFLVMINGNGGTMFTLRGLQIDLWDCDNLLFLEILFPNATKASEMWTLIVGILTMVSLVMIVLRILSILPNKLLSFIYLAAAIVIVVVVLVCSGLLSEVLDESEAKVKSAQWLKKHTGGHYDALEGYKKAVMDVVETDDTRKDNHTSSIQNGHAEPNWLNIKKKAIAYPCIPWYNRAPLSLIMATLYALLSVRAFVAPILSAAGAMGGV